MIERGRDSDGEREGQRWRKGGIVMERGRDSDGEREGQ